MNALSRSILKLEPSINLDSTHYASTSNLLSLQYDEYNFENQELSELKKIASEGSLILDGEEFVFFNEDAVNKKLKLLGSDMILQWGMYGDFQEIILGRGTVKKLSSLTLYEFFNELYVTPNTMCSAAAVILEKSILIRSSALELIFYQKWVEGFNSKSFYFSDSEHELAKQIQANVFNAYSIYDHSDLMVHKDQFIEDLKDIVLHHEMGHFIAQHHFLDHETATFSEASIVFGETIISALLELFADLAINHEGMSGPLAKMKEISALNPNQASGMWWMYCSDTWFFNTENEFMFTYSEMISLFLFSAITNTGVVEFEKINFSYSEILKQRLQTTISKLKNWIESQEEFQDWHEKSIQKCKEIPQVTPYQESILYWVTLFSYIKEDDQFTEYIRNFFEDEKEMILNEMYTEFGLSTTHYDNRIASLNHFVSERVSNN